MKFFCAINNINDTNTLFNQLQEKRQPERNNKIKNFKV